MYGFIAFFKLISPQFYRQTSAIFLWVMMIFAAWFFGFHIEYNVADSKIMDANLLGRDVTIVEVKDNYIMYFSFLIIFSIFVISKVQSLFISGEITPIILSIGSSRSSLLFRIIFSTFIIMLFPYIVLELIIWASVSIQAGESLWNPIIPILSLSTIFLYVNVIVSALLLLTGSRTSTTLFSIVLCFVFPIILELKSRLLYPLFDGHIYTALIDIIDLITPFIPEYIGRSHNVFFNEPFTFSYLSVLIPVTAAWFIASVYAIKKKKY